MKHQVKTRILYMHLTWSGNKYQEVNARLKPLKN